MRKSKSFSRKITCYEYLKTENQFETHLYKSFRKDKILYNFCTT